MGRPKRSSVSRCLFCSKVCDKGTSLIEGGFVGANHFSSLQRQLQHLFVLRHLLDVPGSWCEENLQKNNGDCNPDSWFRLCDNCVDVVAEAYQIYQKLLQVESRLKSVKGCIIEKIRKSTQNLKGKFGSRAISIDNDIRALLCPDLMTEFLPRGESKGYISDVDIDLTNITPENSDCEFIDTFDNEVVDFVPPRKRSKVKERSRKFKNGKKKKKISTAAFHWHICNLCPSRYYSIEEYEAHIVAHEDSQKNGGQYDCQLCSFPARGTDELDLHMNHKHINEKKKTIVYPCSQCEFKSYTWKTLKSHVVSNHPDLPAMDTEWGLKCSECSKEFETRSTMMVHKKKMHPELFGAEQESLQCDKCALLFPDKIRLKYHINSVHFRINRYVCDTCGKGFRFIKGLERHKISHERGKREYVCHICGCDYSYDSILQDHYRKFHPATDEASTHEDGTIKGLEASQKEFSCKYCDLKTPYKTVLIRHIEIHKNEMGFRCDLCEKSYTSAQGLKRHKNINHRGPDSKVQCPFCFKPFPHVEYMKTHMRLYCKVKTIKEKGNDSLGSETSGNITMGDNNVQFPVVLYSTSSTAAAVVEELINPTPLQVNAGGMGVSLAQFESQDAVTLRRISSEPNERQDQVNVDEERVEGERKLYLFQTT